MKTSFIWADFTAQTGIMVVTLCVVSRTERRSGFPHRHAEGLQQLQQLPAEEVTRLTLQGSAHLTSLVLGATFTLDDQIRLF